MLTENPKQEIKHLLAEIEQLKTARTPENAVRLKAAVGRAVTLFEQWDEAINKADSFIKMYQSFTDEIHKFINGCIGAKGYFEERRKVNEMVAFVRTKLVAVENAARDSGVVNHLTSGVVESHRTMLKEAEKLRESLGLLGIVVKISKALFRDAQRLLSRQRIRKPPGTRWLQFTEFFFSPKTVEGTFRPIAADWQYEHFDALNKGRNFKARWISARYNYAFVKTVGLNNLLSFLKWVVSIFKG